MECAQGVEADLKSVPGAMSGRDVALSDKLGAIVQERRHRGDECLRGPGSRYWSNSRICAYYDPSPGLRCMY